MSLILPCPPTQISTLIFYPKSQAVVISKTRHACFVCSWFHRVPHLQHSDHDYWLWSDKYVINVKFFSKILTNGKQMFSAFCDLCSAFTFCKMIWWYHGEYWCSTTPVSSFLSWCMVLSPQGWHVGKTMDFLWVFWFPLTSPPKNVVKTVVK